MSGPSMSNTLYIIGNGFDLHHGIPSQYKQFGEYVKKTDQMLYDLIEENLAFDKSFWNEFESRLATLDTEDLLANLDVGLASYGADDWSDSYHHNFQQEVARIVTSLSTELQSTFTEWIMQLPIPDRTVISDNLLSLDKSARYLNFNYTPTLQSVYDIPNNQVLHIHGSVNDPHESFILGHGYVPENLDPYRDISNPEDTDTRWIEGRIEADSYFKRTFKETGSVIESYKSEFEALSSIDYIIVLGHSLSDIDMPYLKEIVSNINVNTTRWTIAYRSKKSNAQDTMNFLGIPPSLVTFKTWNTI